jgi:prepilin-type N-terminal cleavage/methylation domain-containing protein
MRTETASFDIRYRSRFGRRGFTLTELLVVIGITALLLMLIFTPMMAGFKWMQQGRAMVATQDTARTALEQITRDLSAAVHVYDAPLRWDSAAGIWVVDRSRIDLLLPGRMLAPTPEGSYVGFPLTPEAKVVTYFVGLRDPARPYANDSVNQDEPGPNNLYWLYRAEFDPFHEYDEEGNKNPCYDPSDKYWRAKEWLDRSGPNPGDSDGIQTWDSPAGAWPDGGNAQAIGDKVAERRQYLRDRGQLVALVPIFDCDMVQASWDRVHSVYSVVPGFWLQAAEVSGEVLQPVDVQSYRDIEHSPPTVYTAANGNWGGVPKTGGQNEFLTFADGQIVSDPHITVYDRDGNLVFDSANDSKRNRTLVYNSERGVVLFARRQGVQTIPYIPSQPGTYGDSQNRIAMAGSCVQFTVKSGGTDMAIERTLKVRAVVAGADIIFHRGGAGVGSSGQGYQADPSPRDNEFTTLRADLNNDGIEETLIVKFNYSRLARLMSERNSDRIDFSFDYDVQDNRASDVVRASYSTPNLMAVMLSPRIYPAGMTQAETFQLTATVKPTNLHR